MTRTLIILALDPGDGTKAEFYYGNGLNACGGDYIDELRPLDRSVESVRADLLAKGYARDGAGFDYNAPIGDTLLIWIDSLHILYCEKGIVASVETLRRHGDE